MKFLISHSSFLLFVYSFRYSGYVIESCYCRKDTVLCDSKVWKQRRKAIASLTVGCLSSTEVGPFPSFIVKESVIVRDFVENRQLLADLVVFDAQATRQRKDVPMRLSVLFAEMVRTPTSFGSDQIIVDVPHHQKAYNAIRTKGKYKLMIELKSFYTKAHKYRKVRIFTITYSSVICLDK